MTFDEIVAVVATELNLTSATAITRIGKSVNRGYKEICTDPMIAIDTVGEQLGVQVSTVVGAQQLTWSNLTTTPVVSVGKILRIYNPVSTPATPLFESTVDEITNTTVTGDPAQRWAPLARGALSVTVLLDSIPASIYALQADVLTNTATLSGTQIPAFSENFHDILVTYGKWQELKKMQNYAGAKEEEILYHGIPTPDGRYSGGRLSELRLFLASSMHRKVYQGKTGNGPILSARI